MKIDYLKSWRNQLDRVNEEILNEIKRRIKIEIKIRNLVEEYYQKNQHYKNNTRDKQLVDILLKSNEMNMTESFIRKIFNYIFDEIDRK